MSFTKVDYEDQVTIISAKNMNDIQDTILALEDGLFTVEDDRGGEVIAITDATQRGFRSLNIYGKTTQNGTPTPDAPVGLVSVGDKGNVKLVVSGRNLLPYPFYQTTLTLNGVTYTDNKDGTLFISGTTTNPSSFWFTGYNFALKKGVTYTLSIGDELIATGGPYLWVNSSKNGIVAGLNMTSQKEVTFTPEMDYLDAGIYISASKADMTINGRIRPQIEVGSTATAFEKYKAQNATIATPASLPGRPVSSGGVYTDGDGQQWICNELDLLRGVCKNRVKRTVLQANSYVWYIGADSQQTANTTLFYCYVNDKKQGASNFLCDRFPVRNVIGNTNDFNGICGSTNNIIYVRIDGVYTLEEFTAWLADNPITIVYDIATETETPLTAEEINAYAALLTYKDHTTVFSDGLAYMKLEYVMDAKKYIDGLFAGTIIPATVE